MKHRTMRAFLDTLERAGRLRRVREEVDAAWAPATLAKWMFQAMPEADRFGFLFERVAGSEMPLATGALGASRITYALALDVDPADINAAWIRACNAPVAPRVVERGPAQARVLTGSDADLARLPIPVWTPGKDKAPYITTNVVTRDHDTGVQNMGVYRTMVRDGASVVCNLAPNRQGRMNVDTWHARGKPAPIAWVIAAEPAVHLAAVANLPYGRDELAIAGGLVGAPIDLLRAKTSDLLVPASASIVIEGFCHPGETGPEGPFGEFAGFMGPVEERPVIRVSAITLDEQPLYYGYTSQMPPSESVVIQSLTNSGVYLKLLRHDLGQTSVADVAVDLTFGGFLGGATVAMTPRYPGHGKQVGRILAAATPLKRITVVDPDVDIRDPLHVEWALNARFNPARDTDLLDDVFFPINMDPSVRMPGSTSTMGSKMVIDATAKIDAGPLSLPPKATMERGLDLWNRLGLPPLTVPERARLRIERS